MRVIEEIVAADVIGQAPAAVVVTDTDLQVAVWNSAAEQLFGIAADAASGRSIVDLIIPEAQVGLARQIGERAAAGRAWQGVFDIRRGDGSPIRVHAAIGPLVDADGQVVAVAAVALDAERSEEADRERRLELLVQTSEILAASVEPHAGPPERRSNGGCVARRSRRHRRPRAGRPVRAGRGGAHPSRPGRPRREAARLSTGSRRPRSCSG